MTPVNFDCLTAGAASAGATATVGYFAFDLLALDLLDFCTSTAASSTITAIDAGAAAADTRKITYLARSGWLEGRFVIRGYGDERV